MPWKDLHTEIEAKVRVKDLAVVESRLAVMGAMLHQERVFEHNIRYDDANGSLFERHLVLRLRKDTRARLTFKGAQEPLPNDLQSRFEAEVVVNDFETMDLILRNLGFVPVMVYEKYRTTYSLYGTEVDLDEMPFGNFVEIEGDPAQIEEVIAGLALKQTPRYAQSYAELFANVRGALGLSFTDLTFANFEGIMVPATAFEVPQE